MSALIERTMAKLEAEGDATTRYVPAREPRLSRWCELHALHLVSLSDPDDLGRLRHAVRLADEKYKVYLESIGRA